MRMFFPVKPHLYKCSVKGDREYQSNCSVFSGHLKKSAFCLKKKRVGRIPFLLGNYFKDSNPCFLLVFSIHRFNYHWASNAPQLLPKSRGPFWFLGKFYTLESYGSPHWAVTLSPSGLKAKHRRLL